MAIWIDRYFRSYSTLYNNGTIVPSRTGLNLTGNAIVSVTDNPSLDRTDVQIDIPGANDVAAATASPTPNTLVRRNSFGAASFAGTCGFENQSVTGAISASNIEVDTAVFNTSATFDGSLTATAGATISGGTLTATGGLSVTGASTFTGNLSVTGGFIGSGNHATNNRIAFRGEDLAGGGSRVLELRTGAVNGASPLGVSSPGANDSGNLLVLTGEVGTTGGASSGGILIQSGGAPNGTSGNIALNPSTNASTRGNIALNSTLGVNFQGMGGGLYLANRTAAPSGNATSGLYAYAESGDLKIRSSGGTTITLGAASVLDTLELSGSLYYTSVSGSFTIASSTPGVGVQSRPIAIATGATSSANSGAVTIFSGAVTSGSSSNVQLGTGGSAGGNTGSAYLTSGSVTSGTGTSGNIYIAPGAKQAGGTSGSISLGSGAPSFGGGQRVVYLHTADAAPTGNVAGGCVLFFFGGILYCRIGNSSYQIAPPV